VADGMILIIGDIVPEIYVPLLLGTTPTGLRRKFDIGFSVK
jgi:hypothetical protein